MRVFIDAVGITSSGGATVLWNLMDQLPRAAPEIDWRVFLLPAAGRSFTALPPAGNGRYVEVEGCQGLVSRVWWQQRRLPALCVKERADAVLTVANIGASRPRVPQIVYCHQALLFFKDADVAYDRLSRVRWSLVRRFCVAGMRRSEFVVTQTHCMRDAVLRATGIDPCRVVAVPAGVPRFAESDEAEGTPEQPSRWGEVRRRLEAASRPRLLYVSHPSAHKNFEALLAATAELKRRGVDASCVLTVERDRPPNARYAKFVRDIVSRTEALGITDRTVWVGSLTPSAVGRCMDACEFFVFPSLIESFPQPLVEALPRGAIMLLADQPYAREIAGHAAAYFPPKDPPALAPLVVDLL